MLTYTYRYNRVIDFFKRNPVSKETHGYCELHHILPKSCKGSDDEDNLVLLPGRWHYIVHCWLPYVMLEKNDFLSYKKMLYAWFKMKDKLCFKKEKIHEYDDLLQKSELVDHRGRLIYNSFRKIPQDMTTKEFIYNELKRLAETNYSDPITIEHCIRCGTFLLDVIFSKLIENEYFITNGKYNRHDAWARKFAHIRSSEFKRYDVVKRDSISKKRRLIVSGKSFVDMFVENGLVFRNDRYSNFLTKSFSKSYTLGSEYFNDLIQEHSNSDP